MSYRARAESDALESGQFEVAEIEGHEELSRPYELVVRLVGGIDQTLDEEALLTKPMTVVFESADGIARLVHGVVRQVDSELHTESGHAAWSVKIVPRFADLGLTSTTEIALEMAVPKIVEDRLKRGGLRSGDDFKLSLMKTYPEREFVVQFKESHLDFVGRLTEHLGITYFFSQSDAAESIVFVDDNSAFPSTSLRIPFRPRGEKLDVFELRKVTSAVAGQVRVRDYNYRTPSVDLSGNAKSTGELGEHYEHGNHVKTPGEATELAKVRAEELGWQRSVFEGRSSRPELSPGLRFTLEGHPMGDKQLLVVDVEHRLVQPTFLTQGKTSDTTYENRFRAIEASIPFRPRRRTAKPFVPGVLTGIVEAAQPGEYAEIDDDGRYRVRFQFDKGTSQRGKASRPIRMAQPHAGPGYGFHFPLRDGVEVMLSCVEGDPDRPIIAGAVPNPTTPSTVGARNAKRNIIRTGGGTEINIDDNDKGERLKISVPYGNTILQLGSPNHPDEGVYLGTDKKVHVASDEGMLLEDGEQINAQAPSTWIHGTTDATLEGDATATVKSTGHVVIAAPTVSAKGGALHETAAPVITANADGLWSAASGGVAVLSGGASVAIGGPLIQINGATISVNGDTVTIHATGSVTISGGGAVNIDGPTVKISGGTVDVHGGPIKLNS